MNRTLAFILLFIACSAAADTLLVVNKRDATLALVDPATMKVTGKIATGAEPHEVAVSEDGKIAVVANYGGTSPGSTLTVIDLAAKKEVRRFALPGLSGPHGIQAVGARFYITAEGSRAVARYDVVADRIDWVAGTGQELTHMLVVTRDEKKIYTANIVSNTVSVLDLTGGPGNVGLKHIAVARGPEGIDVAPNGSAVWVAGVARRNETAAISVIDPKSDTVVRTIPITAKLANRLKFSPDGTRVVISDPGMYQLQVFDAATGEALKTITTDAGPAGIVFTPDGKRLFVACADAGKVQVVDTTTWSIIGEVATGAEPDGLAYDGK